MATTLTDRIVSWIRSWRLLSLRSAVVAAFAVYAAVGFLVVPRVARSVLLDVARQATGREATVAAVRCNPFTLSFTIEGFELPDRAGSALVRFESLYVNAQAWSLARRAVVLKEVRLESPTLGLRRFADGQTNVRELLDEIRRRRTPTAAPDAAPSRLPRAILRRIVVTDATLEIEDRDRDEPLHVEYGPSRLELHDISTLPDRRGDHEFVIGIGRGGTIRIVGDVVLDPLGLEGSVAVDGLLLEEVWPLVADRFALDVVGGQATGESATPWPSPTVACTPASTISTTPCGVSCCGHAPRRRTSSSSTRSASRTRRPPGPRATCASRTRRSTAPARPRGSSPTGRSAGRSSYRRRRAPRRSSSIAPCRRPCRGGPRSLAWT